MMIINHNVILGNKAKQWIIIMRSLDHVVMCLNSGWLKGVYIHIFNENVP